jgi:hypothetical protein
MMPDIAIATTGIESFHLTRRTPDAIDITPGFSAPNKSYDSDKPHFV